MRMIFFVLKLIWRIILIPVWLLLAFIGVCMSAVINIYCIAKGFIGLFLGVIFVGTLIWYRTQFINYFLMGVVEFMLGGVLVVGTVILALVTEIRDGIGRYIIGN